MNFGDILTRAFRLVWRNRVLWFLGVLASCAGGGGGGGGSFNVPGNNSGSSSGSSGNADRVMRDVVQWFQNNVETVLVIILVLVCVLALVGFIFWVIGILGRGALVAAVDQLEAMGRTSFREAWQGSTQYWRPLVGMNVLLGLPTLIAVVILAGGIGAITAQMISSTGSRGGLSNDMSSLIFGMACVGIPLFCGLFIYNIFATILRIFGERAIMLEDRAMMDGLRSGWAVFRRNMSNAIILGILLWLISVVAGIVMLLVTLIVAAPLGIGAAITAGQLDNFFNPASMGLVACAGVIIVVLGTLLSGIITAFTSTALTLAYRQFTAPTLPHVQH